MSPRKPVKAEIERAAKRVGLPLEARQVELPVLEEPALVFQQQEAGEQALTLLELAVAQARRALEGSAAGYAGTATIWKAAGALVSAALLELVRTEATFSAAAAYARQEGVVDP